MNIVKKILRYKKCFVYDVEDTIKNIMKIDKMTQSELASRIDMEERTLRRYLNKEIKLTKIVLGLIGVGLKLPNKIIDDMYDNARLKLTLDEEDILIYNAIFNEKNVEKIKVLIKINKNK